MKDPKSAPAGAAPGHYGAGYGEQRPPGAVPEAPPGIDTDATAPAGLEPIDRNLAPDAPAAEVASDADAPVVFTPDDVHMRPPDHTPTEAAPESEKVGLIFERS